MIESDLARAFTHTLTSSRFEMVDRQRATSILAAGSVSPDGNDGLGAILDIDRYGYTVKPEAQCSWRPSPELAVTLGYVMTTSSSNAS